MTFGKLLTLSEPQFHLLKVFFCVNRIVLGIKYDIYVKYVSNYDFVMVIFNKGSYDDGIMLMGMNDVNIVTYGSPLILGLLEN